MSEKVTHEFRVIETEDGFRIELKGDKEELRQLLFGGGWAHFRQFFQRHGFDRHGFGHHQHQHGPFPQEKETGMPRSGRHQHHHYDLGPWWDETPTGEDA